MPSHALDQRLFEQTNSLTDDNNAVLASPQDGIQLINSWLRVIEGETSTQLIESDLIALRDELSGETPDEDRVKQLLLNLADNTALVAQSRNVQQQTEGKLDDVAFTLRTLAGL